jgi:hypothetical protein
MILRKIWTVLDKLSKFQEMWGTRILQANAKSSKPGFSSILLAKRDFFA